MTDITEWGNLAAAFGRAARGKRGRADVEAYRQNLDRELEALHRGLMRGDYPIGRMRGFTIRDPKPREIHAPVFSERVLHHALMAKVGPVLDRVLPETVYACRTGKGALSAVRHVQRCARLNPWYAQIDIRQYFPSIDHSVLRERLARKFSDHNVLSLLGRVIDSHHDEPGRGLPIGALTSQHFANYYLASADRVISAHSMARGYARYMDDLIWWGVDKVSVRSVLDEVCYHISEDLRLEIKTPIRIGRSRNGISFCGYRIFPGRLLLSRRKKSRFAAARRHVEAQYLRGEVGPKDLQHGMDAALAITANADCLVWRRAQLRRTPVARALAEA